eukprot:15481062-Alexandrium_andersonii.AAC.1
MGALLPHKSWSISSGAVRDEPSPSLTPVTRGQLRNMVRPILASSAVRAGREASNLPARARRRR